MTNLRSPIANPLSTSSSQRWLGCGADVLPDLRPFFRDGLAQIVFRLKSDQEGCGDSEVAFKTKGGIGRHSLPSGKDVAEPTAGNGHVTRGFCRWNQAGFQLVMDQPGGGIGTEFHGFSGCLRFERGKHR